MTRYDKRLHPTLTKLDYIAEDFNEPTNSIMWQLVMRPTNQASLNAIIKGENTK